MLHVITLCCLLENSYTLPFSHAWIHLLYFPMHSPLLHYNEYCIVHWCMTKFTLPVSFCHLLCIPFVCMTQSSKSAYNLNQSIVEKLPSFVKIASPFKKPILYKSAFLVGLICFCDLTHLLLASQESVVAWLWLGI